MGHLQSNIMEVRQRFAQTSSLWWMVWVPSKPKAQTPSVLLIAYLTCTTSSPCFYRKFLEKRGNSWWIIHCVPSQLYCSLSSTGRVICTTTSHSPNTSGNKGSLSAAVYPKDMQRTAGGVGETAGVWNSTQCNPFSGCRGIAGQGGLGTPSHIQVYLPALVPSPLSLFPT